MTTQQFLKGLLMVLMAVVVAAFSTTPVDYAIMIVTLIGVTLSYSGKNLVAVLHSDSPPGSLSLINIISGVLVAIGTGFVDYIGYIVIGGVILWGVLLKVTLSVFFTYISTTWFAPPHNITKKKLFVSKKIHS